MQILRIEDPRDSLNKASRYELCKLAEAYGISEISYHCGLQLEDMVKILRNRGITEIKLPDRPLGVYKPVLLNSDVVPEQPQAPISVEEPKHEAPTRSVDQMAMGELRSECKRLGIKMARTDNLNSLREKLRDKNAA